MLWAIIGLPGSGRTTLFNLITHRGASARSGKGADIAVIKVPDPRLDELVEIFQPKKITHAEVEFTDSIGRIGKGGAAFSELQRANSFVYCIRAFDAGFGEPDPITDLHVLVGELTLFDLGVVERRLDSMDKLIRSTKPGERQRVEREGAFLEQMKAHLDSGGVIRDLELSPEQKKMVDNFALLTAKPTIVVINCDEERFAQKESIFAEAREGHKNTEIIAIMSQIELELGELDDGEAGAFREELGLKEAAVDKFVHAAYKAMKVKTFFTGGDPEVHAWTARGKATALECAGKIHTDIARGFIRAETIHYDEFVEIRDWSKARSSGKLRQEGKDYLVADGDIMLIKFAI